MQTLSFIEFYSFYSYYSRCCAFVFVLVEAKSNWNDVGGSKNALSSMLPNKKLRKSRADQKCWLWNEEKLLRNSTVQLQMKRFSDKSAMDTREG